jgi:hypothetical protein
VFVGFSRIFLLGILIFKGLTARRLYKPFGVKGLMVFKEVVYVYSENYTGPSTKDAVFCVLQNVLDPYGLFLP